MSAESPVDARERVMSLILALLHTETALTADELWERIPGYARITEKPAFLRAFARDKNDVRKHTGALVVETVQTSDVPVDGYRIDRNKYYLDMPPMSADELAALRLASMLVRIGDNSATDGLLRLGGLEPTGVDPEGAVPLVNVETAGGTGDLFAAITDRATVHFSYSDVERTVNPYLLELKGGRWYLSGHDHGHNEVRIFRVDRISGAITTDAAGTFVRDPDLVVRGLTPPWMYSGGEPVTARILVDADHVDWVIQQTGGRAEMERLDDGSAILSMTATHYDNLRWFVLELLDHGELLEPVELRDELVSWLEALV